MRSGCRSGLLERTWSEAAGRTQQRDRGRPTWGLWPLGRGTHHVARSSFPDPFLEEETYGSVANGDELFVYYVLCLWLYGPWISFR